jgi:endonuclease YncB( thermonuclease family)
LPAQTVGLIRAIDGDTAEFGTQTIPSQKVRFLFVNTEESYGPETTAFGTASSAVIHNYLGDAGTIVLRVREDRGHPGQPSLDPYDRWLSLVFVDGDLFQTRIVREGLSAYYTQFGCAPEPVHSALLYAEAEARANKRGIWRDGHPTDYRRVFERWIGSSTCRPNPFQNERYCR